MAQSAIEKRLERLERSVGIKKANRVNAYYSDGSSREMDALSLACAVFMRPESAPVRYEPLGEIRAGKLLQVVDSVMCGE